MKDEKKTKLKSNKNQVKENTLDLGDEILIKPDFYKQNPDDETILETKPNLSTDDNQQTIDLDAETLASSKNNISNKSKDESIKIDQLKPFTDSLKQEDIDDFNFDSKTIFAPGGDLDAIDLDTDILESEEQVEDIPVVPIQDVQPEEDSSQKQTIDLDAKTVAVSSLDKLLDENLNEDQEEIIDSDSETIVVPQKDLQSIIPDDATIVVPQNDLQSIVPVDSFDDEDDIIDLNTETIMVSTEELSPLDLDDIIEQKSDKTSDDTFDRDSTTVNGPASSSEPSSEPYLLKPDEFDEPDDSVVDLDTDAVVEKPVEELQPLDLDDIVETDQTLENDDSILDLGADAVIDAEPTIDESLDPVPVTDQDDINDSEPTVGDLIDNLDIDESKNNLESSGDTIDIGILDTDDASPDTGYIGEKESLGTDTSVLEEEPVISDSEPEDNKNKISSDKDDDWADISDYDDEQYPSISPKQIEAALERVINKIFSQRIEKILAEVVEKAVAEEIKKFRLSLMEDLTDEEDF